MDFDRISSLLHCKGKKILLYHTDSDGISSAVLILKFFSGFELIPMDGPIMDDKFVTGLIAKKPELLLVLDIPIDQEWKKVERLQKQSPGTRMLIIDHHIPEKNLNSAKNVHINPRFERNVYVPASALVYGLLEKLGKDVKPFIWIAAIGVIGDYAFEDCKDLLDECMKVYPEIGKDPKSSRLAEISDGMMSAVVLHGDRGVRKSLEILLQADNFASLLNNRYIAGCKKKVTGEIKSVLSDFKKNAKEYPDLDLFIYRIRSRLNIASTISTMLAEKHPDKIILVTKHGKQYVKISARYQAGAINLSDLLKRTVAGIGFGGGHEKAGGALVGKNHMREFERRLLARITELRAR